MAAFAFKDQRLNERVSELEELVVLNAEPLVELLRALEKDSEALDRMRLSSEHLEAFRARLVEACERAADLPLWLPPSEVASMVGMKTETVRRWRRRDQVRFRKVPTGYLINVEDALKLAGKM